LADFNPTDDNKFNEIQHRVYEQYRKLFRKSKEKKAIDRKKRFEGAVVYSEFI